MKLIDISKWQKGIDLSKAKKAGYGGVIVRIAYGTKEDPCASGFITEARKAGMWIGMYLYSTAKFSGEAEDEAKFAVEFANINGMKDAIVYYDREESKNKVVETKCIRAFVNTIRTLSATLYTGVYSGMSFFNNYIGKELIEELDIPIWIARYNSKQPEVGIPVNIWQYTSDAYRDDFYKEKLDRSIVLDPSVVRKAPVEPEENEISTLTENERIAVEVVQDKWGVGEQRVIELEDSGYSPLEIQGIVNKYFPVAIDVIAGKLGNGKTRVNNYMKLGLKPELARAFVNAMV